MSPSPAILTIEQGDCCLNGHFDVYLNLNYNNRIIHNDDLTLAIPDWLGELVRRLAQTHCPDCGRPMRLSSLDHNWVCIEELCGITIEKSNGVVLRLGSGCYQEPKSYIAALWTGNPEAPLIALENNPEVIPALAPLLNICEECGVTVERSEP